MSKWRSTADAADDIAIQTWSLTFYSARVSITLSPSQPFYSINWDFIREADEKTNNCYRLSLSLSLSLSHPGLSLSHPGLSPSLSLSLILVSLSHPVLSLSLSLSLSLILATLVLASPHRHIVLLCMSCWVVCDQRYILLISRSSIFYLCSDCSIILKMHFSRNTVNIDLIYKLLILVTFH